MVKRIMLSLFFSGIAAGLYAQAYNANDQTPPPGMEYRQVGNYRQLVPKDSREVQVAPGVMTNETKDQYTARKFQEIDQRLANLEQTQQQIIADLEQLKQVVQQLVQLQQQGANQ